VDDEQIRSEGAGLIRLALNWDHKQALAIMVMNLWVSQNSGKVLTRSVTTSWSRLSVSSFNHSSNVSSCFSAQCGNIFKNNDEDVM
jgi:hypothetical protein